ncbi:MAG TPA: YihY/virulence factor BrkB family protein [Sphingomonadales bacterium]|nr:YihY/virulence factor BrkB family protein [Sphingomonadales bacterium]
MARKPKAAPSRSGFPAHLLRSFKGFGRHNMLAHAGNLAFMGILAFFPFLIVLIALAGFFGRTEAGFDVIQFVYGQVPGAIVAQVKGPIDLVMSETSGNILTVSILIALWTTVRGTAAARAGVLAAYGISYRKAGHALLAVVIDFLVVLALLLLIIVALAVLITGPTVVAAIEAWMPGHPALAQYWAWARYGVSPLVLYIALYGLYFAFVPRYGRKKLYHAPGALLALAIWFVMAAGFALYLQHLAGLNLLYGSLTGIIILQLFIYLQSLGFLLGAELNASYTEAANA